MQTLILMPSWHRGFKMERRRRKKDWRSRKKCGISKKKGTLKNVDGKISKQPLNGRISRSELPQICGCIESKLSFQKMKCMIFSMHCWCIFFSNLCFDMCLSLSFRLYLFIYIINVFNMCFYGTQIKLT